jgi:hypothetical protein
MLHPIGRLPPQVYWRRRLMLVGIVIALSLAAGWFFIGGASGDPDGTAADPSAVGSSEEPTTDGPLTALEQVVPSLAPADPVEATESGVPAEGSTPAPTPAPAEPGPCPDEAIGLTVGAEFPQYPVGSKPLLSLNITNISAVPCLRDLDVALQTWGLFAADGTRLWGSNDCYPDPSVPNVSLLQPGQLVNFSIIWSGRTSDPTCTLPRQTLGPGTYILRGYLANLVSPDAALVLV